MIYDCFMFSNELDILEIRLNELKDVVDKFVIIESETTTSGLPKKLYFKENMDRFKDFKDKIIYSSYQVPTDSKDAWVREEASRNTLKYVLGYVKAEDIVIISDADEITSREAIEKFDIQTGGRTLVQKFFYYRLNCYIPSYIWGWSKIVSGQTYNQLSPQAIRYARMMNMEVPGGWHFSFIGTPQMIADKIKSFAHQEYNKSPYIDLDHIISCMDTPKDIFNRPEYILQYVPVDNTFPEYIQKNAGKYIEMGLIK